MRRINLVATLVCAVLFMAGVAAMAGEHDDSTESDIGDRFRISAGGFLARFDTKVRLDSETLGTGTEIDLEDDTNLDRSQTDFRLDGYVRMGRRHRLDFGGIVLERSASATIDESFQFGDTVYDIDADVATSFGSDIIKLAYRYSVVRNPRWELGLSLGISAWITEASLTGEGTVGGVVGVVSEESEDFVAPIPVLGIGTEVALGGDWSFRADGEFFDVSINDDEGAFTDVRAAVEWFPFKHFGFGAGYNQVWLSFTSNDDTAVDLDYTFSGATVYVTYAH